MPVRRQLSRGTLVVVGWAAAALILSAPARAQDYAGGTAESLRQQGEALLVENRFAEACPKLDQSYRLDSATGTLLSLAMCHEGQGKLASAWAEFTEVSTRAGREGRPDRAEIARQHADALRPKLSYLVVEVSPEAAQGAELEIRQDGVRLDRTSWSKPLPIDPGDHVVEASAPGKTAWRKPFRVGPTASRETVLVPALVSLSIAVPTVSPAEPPARGLDEVQVAGIVAAAVGVVGLGLGIASGVRAMNKKHASDPQCDHFNRCRTATAFDQRQDAVHAAGFSTVTIFTGAFFVLSGATMFFVGGHSRRENTASVRAAPALLPGGGGVAMSGRF